MSSGGKLGPRDVICIRLHIADVASRDHAMQFGVVTVESAVEVDHRDDAALSRVPDRFGGSREIEVYRLLAQHMQIRLCRTKEVVGVCVGG